MGEPSAEAMVEARSLRKDYGATRAVDETSKPSPKTRTWRDELPWHTSKGCRAGESELR